MVLKSWARTNAKFDQPKIIGMPNEYSTYRINGVLCVLPQNIWMLQSVHELDFFKHIGTVVLVFIQLQHHHFPIRLMGDLEKRERVKCISDMFFCDTLILISALTFQCKILMTNFVAFACR